MTRPIGIGVFGCPFYEESEFELAVYADDGAESEYMEEARDDEESMLWSLFIGIVKIILDIML